MAKRIVVRDSITVQPLNDDAIVLDLDTEVYFSLNSSAYHMWEILTSTPTVEEALRQLCADYDVPEVVLRTDLERLLLQLEGHQLIEIWDVQE